MPDSPAPLRPARDPARPLAVMHIPKTSGMALIGGLLAALRPRQVVSGFDRCLFGSFNQFDTMSPEVRRTIYLTPDQVPRGADVVAAHMSYATLSASYPAAQMVTFLREPRVRLLSHWAFWRGQDKVGAQGWGAWATVSSAGREPLARFLGRRDLAAQTDNLALRMLLSPHPAIPHGDFINERNDPGLLATALGRLGRFAHADVIEHPALIGDFSAWLGSDIVYVTVNETPRVPAAFRTRLDEELSGEALDLLQARSRLDATLWSALAERFASRDRAAALAQGTFLRGIARYAQLMAP